MATLHKSVGCCCCVLTKLCQCWCGIRFDFVKTNFVATHPPTTSICYVSHCVKIAYFLRKKTNFKFPIFSCKVHEHQTALASQGAVNALHLLLLSPLPDVQLPALQCLAFLVYGNSTVASLVVESTLEDGQTLVESVVALMERNRKAEMQLHAARVICYLNR